MRIRVRRPASGTDRRDRCGRGRPAHRSPQSATPMAGLCLDVSRASTANGTPVRLWSCSGASNQRWTLG
ncbi:RICIN domain-containing protein [Flindersiella endophytica]